MMASKIPKYKKGNSVAIGAFKSWGEESIFGVKTVVHPLTGLMMVNFIWCNLCLKHEKDFMNSLLVKGRARIAAHSFINGTISVTKYRVCLVMTEDVRFRLYC